MDDERQGTTEERTRLPQKPPDVDRETDPLPERIGPYRILRRIGAGGMGEVYHAEQEEPIRRKVALKVIKWGMDTKQVVARFESERQALAMMDHRSIARVFDAGATPEGRPYFVMEFVTGEPITDYCDRHRLGVRQRLEIFCEVCNGVQHAHHKGIIHRDLKPSNILVTVQGDRPVPKIIDFGLAKATQQRLTEKTMVTGFGQVVGTPAYMSPEQAEMTGLDIDTRTDVYSLGVLLYELLVGVLPFPIEEFRGRLDEFRRKIREDDPLRPSSRISSLGDASMETGRRRGIDPKDLTRRLRGDLDWIVMRALEKDRTRRYGSPSELAADVTRHLNNEPVQARPPSSVYRLQKFVRRHRFGVAAAMGILVALLAGVLLATVGFIRARQSEREARRAENSAEDVADFLVSVFEVSDPNESRGNSVTARELLDQAVQRIDTGLETDALTRARLQHTMGRVYHSLGLYDQAGKLLEDALQVRRQELGASHASVAETLSEIGSLDLTLGRDDEAAARHREALSINEASEAIAWRRPGAATTLRGR